MILVIFKMRKTGAALLMLSLGLLLIFAFRLTPKTDLVSPVLGISSLDLSSNVWLPEDFSNLKFPDAPNISAQAAFFVETRSGKVLYEKNAQERMPIASLVKIMTAIVALEFDNSNLVNIFEKDFSVSPKAAEMEPDKMLLVAGEKLTLEELLDGIFLVSANDAAEVLAEGVTGIRDHFIGLMNAKALALGMKNTLFVNPTGLDEDTKDNFSSALDVALMTRYAVARWPKLVEISAKEHIYLPRTKTHQDYDLYTGINLVSSYPGVIGFKTGYTPKAGLTLATLFRKGEIEILGVLLGATDRRSDAKLLLDYSLAKLGVN